LFTIYIILFFSALTLSLILTPLVMKTALKIEGMTCEHCVKHATDALLGVDGVKKAKVNLKKAGADVVHNDDVSIDALCAAVKEAGFTASAA
jgi:copper chaperone CopZ